MSAARCAGSRWPRVSDHLRPSDPLDRVDFKDPKVRAAIEKAARDWKPTPVEQRRLDQFKPVLPSPQVLLTVWP